MPHNNETHNEHRQYQSHSRATRPKANSNWQSTRKHHQATSQRDESLQYSRHAHRYAARERELRNKKRARVAALSCVAIIALCALCFGAVKAFNTATSAKDPLGNEQQMQQSTTYAKEEQTTSQSDDDPGDIVIGVNGDTDTYMLRGEEYIEGGAHAASPSHGVLTPAIEINGSVDPNTVGDYIVTYTASDSEGHTAKAERTVHVVDTMDTMKTGVPVLMYHYVYDESNPPSDLNGNWILDTKVDEHMQYLNDNGFYYPSFPEVQAFIEGKHSLPAKSVVLTFDDGEDGTLGFLDALSSKHRIPVTSFMICSDQTAAANKVAKYASPYVQFESHSISMHQPGGTIGHGGRISAMTKDEILSDLRDSAAIVGSGQAFAYPFGDTTPDGQTAVSEAGLNCAFTTKNDWCYIGDDITALNRVRISGEYSIDSFVYLVNEQ